jgi:hypothetical protein
MYNWLFMFYFCNKTRFYFCNKTSLLDHECVSFVQSDKATTCYKNKVVKNWDVVITIIQQIMPCKNEKNGC